MPKRGVHGALTRGLPGITWQLTQACNDFCLRLASVLQHLFSRPEEKSSAIPRVRLTYQVASLQKHAYALTHILLRNAFSLSDLVDRAVKPFDGPDRNVGQDDQLLNRPVSAGVFQHAAQIDLPLPADKQRLLCIVALVHRRGLSWTVAGGYHMELKRLQAQIRALEELLPYASGATRDHVNELWLDLKQLERDLLPTAFDAGASGSDSESQRDSVAVPFRYQ